MSDLVRKFCDSIHGKLSTLESRIEILKANSGATWTSLQEKLAEIRERSEVNKEVIRRVGVKLERWRSDIKQIVDSEGSNADNRQATSSHLALAEEAEQNAEVAIQLAEASIDEVERMILEAISIRLKSESEFDSQSELESEE